MGMVGMGMGMGKQCWALMQTTHVKYANDVIHLDNIEWWKSSHLQHHIEKHRIFDCGA